MVFLPCANLTKKPHQKAHIKPTQVKKKIIANLSYAELWFGAEGHISNWNKLNLYKVTFTYECFFPQSFSDCSLDAVQGQEYNFHALYLFDHQAMH